MLRAVTILLKGLFDLFQTCDGIKDANCCCSVASLVLEPALRYTAYWCIWSVLWNKLAKYSRFRSTRIKLLAAYEGLDIFFRKNLYGVDLISWSRPYMEMILQYWCMRTSSYNIDVCVLRLLSAQNFEESLIWKDKSYTESETSKVENKRKHGMQYTMEAKCNKNSN